MSRVGCVVGVVGVAALACQNDGLPETTRAWGGDTPSDAGTEGTAGSAGSDDAAGTGSVGGEPQSEDGAGTSGPDSSGGSVVDCTPWSSPWIGAPCDSDADCEYSGGFCLGPAQGFPCGMCSLDCDEFCPDAEGVPETFCVDGTDLGLDEVGYCVSKCDASFHEGLCRPEYSCAVLERFGQPAVSDGSCVPGELAGPASGCQEMLAAAGVDWVPAEFEPDTPSGFPELQCDIEDPVWLYSPVSDVLLRYATASAEAPVLLSCETALALAQAATIASKRGVVEIQHLGTYNCRTISGSSDLSMHGLGLAIDISGFAFDDDTVYTLFDDWEDGVVDPVTEGGRFLRSFADAVFDEALFTVILTPEYNAAHDDHFHLDRTPGSSFYE